VGRAFIVPLLPAPRQGGGTPCGQYISNKKVCESNKADSQVQIDGFSLCHMGIKIPYLKCIAPCGCRVPGHLLTVRERVWLLP